MSSSRNVYLFFILSLFAVVLTNCSSELIVQKDPVAPTAGDYKITGTASYTINGAISSTPVSGTLSVFVGQDAKTYYFLEKVGTAQLGYLITCIGEKIIVGPAQESTKYKNTTYYGIQNGNGTLSANQIEIDRYANTNGVGITSPTGEHYTYTMPIRKHVHIVATR